MRFLFFSSFSTLLFFLIIPSANAVVCLSREMNLPAVFGSDCVVVALYAYLCLGVSVLSLLCMHVCV